MIILDIETSGLTGREGIWQIGAIDLNNLNNYFLQEARLDEGDLVSEGALKVIGKSEEELRNKKKQSQRDLIFNYLSWVEKINEKIFLGHNIGWDLSMIQDKCIKYDLHTKFLQVHGQRGIDLHSIAQEKYFDLNKKYQLNDFGKSSMNLSSILEFCGIKDNRNYVQGTTIMKQGKYHDALNDCKLEAEAYWRIKFRENLFNEFKEFEIPEVLKK